MFHCLPKTLDFPLFCCLCLSIQALLSAPNPDDPLSENIAKHWKSNEAEAVETGIVSVLFLKYTNSLYASRESALE